MSSTRLEIREDPKVAALLPPIRPLPSDSAFNELLRCQSCHYRVLQNGSLLKNLSSRTRQTNNCCSSVHCTRIDEIVYLRQCKSGQSFCQCDKWIWIWRQSDDPLRRSCTLTTVNNNISNPHYSEPSWTAEGKLESIVLINSTRGSIKEKVFKRTGHQVDDRKNHKLVHFSPSRALKPWRSSLIEDVPLIPASERGTLESFVDSTTDSAGKNNCRVPWLGRNTRRSRFLRWFCSCNSPDPHSPDSSKDFSICGLARNDKTNSRLPTVTKRRRSVTKSFVELKPTSVQRIWLIRPFRCTQSHKEDI